MFKDPIASKELTITDVLQSEQIELDRIPYTCYYEPQVCDSDWCFGYVRKGSSDLFLFQLESKLGDQSFSQNLLSGLDIENPGFLTLLVEEAKELVEETPMNISSLKDLRKEIELDWDPFVITYLSRDAIFFKKSLYRDYSNRVITRNSESV